MFLRPMYTFSLTVLEKPQKALKVSCNDVNIKISTNKEIPRFVKIN